MAESSGNSENLTDIEAALQSLTPRPTSIDRDRLLFLAGRASVLMIAGAESRGFSDSGNPNADRGFKGKSRSSRDRLRLFRKFQPLVTLVTLAAAVGFAWAFFARGETEPRVVERIVYVDRPVEEVVPVPSRMKKNPSVVVPLSRRADPLLQQGSGRFVFTSLMTRRMVRLRYPVLAISADNLPDPQFHGDNDVEIRSGDRRISSYRNMRAAMLPTEKPAAKLAPATLRIFNWRIPFGAGDEL